MESSKVVLIGFGNPLLDVSASVPLSMLDKYEVKSGDVILADEKHMGLYDELITSYSPDYIAGGATQNSMRVAAWMLGGKCAFVGCVGADDPAKTLKDKANEGGVVVEYQVDESPTGLCGCLIDETNERTLITRLDAANNYKVEHLQSEPVQKLLAQAQVVYSAGFFLTSGGPPCTTALGKHCVDFNKHYCLNLSAPFIPQFFGDALDATMPYVDILFGNETEAAALGEARGWGSDLTVIAKEVAKMPKASGTYARVVVFTQGASSTLVATSDKATSYPVPPISKDAIVDTNGAGDAFVGGFLSRFVLGQSLDKCVEAGHWAARTIIQRSGCTMPAECDFVSTLV